MVTIEGMICDAPSGCAQDSEWDMVLFLAPWKHPDGRVEQTELRVEFLVGTSVALTRAMNALSDGIAVRVTTEELVPPGPATWWYARATKLAKAATAPALDEARRERERPIVVRDPVLGRLVLDRKLRAFVGRRTVGGKRYKLWVLEKKAADAAAQVKAAQGRVSAFERGYDRTLAAVTKWMFPLYNDNWRGDRSRMTAQQLARRLKLDTVQVGPERTTAHFEVGDIFADHAVEVRLGPRGNIREITLAG